MKKHSKIVLHGKAIICAEHIAMRLRERASNVNPEVIEKFFDSIVSGINTDRQPRGDWAVPVTSFGELQGFFVGTGRTVASYLSAKMTPKGVIWDRC